MSRPRLLACLGLVVLTALVVSSIAPYDRATWLMEVAPVLIGAPVHIALHALALILGGAYTSARVPLGFWLEGLFALTQNPSVRSSAPKGDPWDTQSDMFMALIGAVTALLTLSRLQDRQIERLSVSEAGVTLPGGG